MRGWGYVCEPHQEGVAEDDARWTYRTDTPGASGDSKAATGGRPNKKQTLEGILTGSRSWRTGAAPARDWGLKACRLKSEIREPQPPQLRLLTQRDGPSRGLAGFSWPLTESFHFSFLLRVLCLLYITQF